MTNRNCDQCARVAESPDKWADVTYPDGKTFPIYLCVDCAERQLADIGKAITELLLHGIAQIGGQKITVHEINP